MKKKIIFILFVTVTSIIPQSRLTLEECYSRARENFPLIKQKQYIEKSKEFSVSNIWKGYFPQISVSGQATYQSEVTSIPISFPGIKIDQLTLDQYKVAADVSQVIYDGGVMSAQSDVQKASAESDDQKVEIELLKVKDRINQIYFGIILFDEQLVQTTLMQNDLKASIDKVLSAFKNGTATQPNVDVLKAELLKANQKEIELKSSRKAFIDMLGLLVNLKLDESIGIEKPVMSSLSEGEEINRPELKLYSSQEKMIESQNGLTVSKILPKASLFFQGGYGKPTLNMLKNSFDWYYVAGAKLSWSPTSLYTYGNEKEIIELNKKSVEAQKETFLLNTNLTIKQVAREIEKLNELIDVDKQIITIRTSVKEAAKSQLENGVITSNDFIRELNAEDQAKQNLAIHSTQLLLAKYNYLITIGK